MYKSKIEKILILAKTYPSPSSKHIETSCVAGINEEGVMRRLYPIPFRLISESQQFKKWQWIDVRIEKSNKDNRPESYKIYTDGLVCNDLIKTKKLWLERRKWIEQIPCFDTFSSLKEANRQKGISLALLRPSKINGLLISKARQQDWTEEEKSKLLQAQMQDDIFTENQAKAQIKQLRKIPYDFYYEYQCNGSTNDEHRHKIVDWEAGQLFWNCHRSHGSNWENPFRAKLIDDLGNKDLMFLVGNIHRFQEQWLIISLIYPPKQTQPVQTSLF
jgi:hypothetical protein